VDNFSESGEHRAAELDRINIRIYFDYLHLWPRH
jgi:hypothetical protein